MTKEKHKQRLIIDLTYLEAGVVISEFVNDGVRGEPFITRDQQEMFPAIP